MPPCMYFEISHVSRHKMKHNASQKLSVFLIPTKLSPASRGLLLSLTSQTSVFINLQLGCELGCKVTQKNPNCQSNSDFYFQKVAGILQTEIDLPSDVGRTGADVGTLWGGGQNPLMGGFVPCHQVLTGDAEGGGLGLAGLQAELGEILQLLERIPGRRLLLADVELDGLLALAAAGVGHVDGDNPAVGRGGDGRYQAAFASDPPSARVHQQKTANKSE